MIPFVEYARWETLESHYLPSDPTSGSIIV